MSLKKKTINGIAWNGAGNIARQILTVVTLIVMARFLTPDDFGIFAILMIFVGFMNIFATMGTSQAVIHLDSPSKRMLSSIFYFNVGMGLVLFGLLYILAWPIADFYEKPNLVHLLQLTGLTFIITTLSLVQKAVLEKSMLFKRVVALETLALALSSFAGMLAALLDFGIYSLIIMVLSNAAILSLGLWISAHWRPSLQFSFKDIKEVLDYSLQLTGFSFINYFARQSDQFLIGKFIGSGALGIYSVAYKIILYPLENISRVIIRVLFPAFSEIKHDNVRFKNAYIKAISFIALVTFPLMAGLAAVSQNFVDVVLGEKWTEMGMLLIILAPIGLLQSIVTTVGSIFMAKGTTGLMFKIGALNAAVTVISFLVGISFGIEGVAIAYAVANLIMLYPNLKISWDQIELGVFEGLEKLTPFFLISTLMAIIVYYLGQGLVNLDISKLGILAIQIFTGVFVYIVLLMLFHRTVVVKMVFFLIDRKK
jgi:O-antigen/teichoic acid export membrane protein